MELDLVINRQFESCSLSLVQLNMFVNFSVMN